MGGFLCRLSVTMDGGQKAVRTCGGVRETVKIHRMRGAKNMRKQRSAGRLTKRALATSVMAMLLCVVMLVGTTFAWFTDSVTSGVNTIIAGNLDVELDYYDTAAGDWKSVGADNDLFPLDTLWEPGHTEIVYLRIRNAGTLALRYAMLVTPVKETPGLRVDGNDLYLSEYLDFGWADVNTDENDALTPYDRTGARDAVTEWVKLGEALRNNDSDEALLPGASKCLALVVYMPETVGNEANYLTGTNAPTIELGVTLQATQKDSEDDSFGNDYDKDAEEEITVPKFDYDYENAGVLYTRNDAGEIIGAIVPGVMGKVPDGFFTNSIFDKLTTVEIQEGVTEIGDQAFNMCTAIKSLELPSTLKTVGYRAFHHLHALKSVNIPEGTVLEEGAFRASGLEEVTVNGGSIGAQAFYNCPNLKKVTVNCETVGNRAFASCNSLETVDLVGVKVIENNAFEKCSKLTTITIPESVVSLGVGLFSNAALKSAVVNAQCDTLPANMFFNCGNLQSLELSDTITKTEAYAVARDYNVTSCKVKAGTWKIGNKTFETDEHGYLPEAARKALFVRNSPVATYIPMP